MKINVFLKRSKIICHLSNNLILFSKGHKIYTYNLNSNEISFLNKLPSKIYFKVIFYSNLLSRLFRHGVNIGIQKDENSVLLVFNKKIYDLDLLKNSVSESFKLKRGRRPLNLTKVQGIKGFNNQICFGEYFMNFKKEEVHIYSLNNGDTWKVSYTFPKGEIEHIHNIIPDKSRNLLWILTGDFYNASGIWIAKDNFNEVYPVVRGKQNYRACVAFPIKEGLLYGTDSQFEENSIRLLFNQNGWKTKKIFDVNGPIIYGSKLKKDFVFSTSVEGESHNKGKILQFFDKKKGNGIKTNYSHIIKGNLNNGFRVIYKNKKDRYPFILFQFGTLIFPNGENNSNSIFFNVNALKSNDQSIIKINI